jgi:hypothetical protein
MLSGEAHATLIEIGRCSQKETSMANDNKDQPVLSHIDTLVKEEERLYAQRDSFPDPALPPPLYWPLASPIFLEFSSATFFKIL